MPDSDRHTGPPDSYLDELAAHLRRLALAGRGEDVRGRNLLALHVLETSYAHAWLSYAPNRDVGRWLMMLLDLVGARAGLGPEARLAAHRGGLPRRSARRRAARAGRRDRGRRAAGAVAPLRLAQPGAGAGDAAPVDGGRALAHGLPLRRLPLAGPLREAQPGQAHPPQARRHPRRALGAAAHRRLAGEAPTALHVLAALPPSFPVVLEQVQAALERVDESLEGAPFAVFYALVTDAARSGRRWDPPERFVEGWAYSREDFERAVGRTLSGVHSRKARYRRSVALAELGLSSFFPATVALVDGWLAQLRLLRIVGRAAGRGACWRGRELARRGAGPPGSDRRPAVGHLCVGDRSDGGPHGAPPGGREAMTIPLSPASDRRGPRETLLALTETYLRRGELDVDARASAAALAARARRPVSGGGCRPRREYRRQYPRQYPRRHPRPRVGAAGGGAGRHAARRGGDDGAPGGRDPRHAGVPGGLAAGAARHRHTGGTRRRPAGPGRPLAGGIARSTAACGQRGVPLRRVGGEAATAADDGALRTAARGRGRRGSCGAGPAVRRGRGAGQPARADPGAAGGGRVRGRLRRRERGGGRRAGGQQGGGQQGGGIRGPGPGGPGRGGGRVRRRAAGRPHCWARDGRRGGAAATRSPATSGGGAGAPPPPPTPSCTW